MKIVPFEKEHVLLFKNYGGQESLCVSFDMAELEELKRRGPAFTGFVNDTIIGCAGLIEMNQYRAIAWALFQKTNPKNFVPVHMAARKFFAETTYKRVEAYVNPQSNNAMRWVQQLGFTVETPYIPYYFPDTSGATCWVLHK